ARGHQRRPDVARDDPAGDALDQPPDRPAADAEGDFERDARVVALREDLHAPLLADAGLGLPGDRAVLLPLRHAQDAAGLDRADAAQDADPGADAGTGLRPGLPLG